MTKCIHIEYYTSYHHQWLIYSCIYLTIIRKGKLKYFAPSRDDSMDAESAVCVVKSHKQ
jgi:hypothetical protein